MKSVDVYLALGSNIKPELHMARALEMLTEHIPILRLSMFYWTPALHRPDNPAFLNGACLASTTAPPEALKWEVLRPIEKTLGRTRTGINPYGPRPIDIDIVLYGDVVRHDRDITLPDPDLFTRRFLARCLLDINPGLVVPGTRTLLADLIHATTEGTEMHPDVTFSQKMAQWLQARQGECHE